jgi:hypothetical protein
MSIRCPYCGNKDSLVITVSYTNPFMDEDLAEILYPSSNFTWKKWLENMDKSKTQLSCSECFNSITDLKDILYYDSDHSCSSGCFQCNDMNPQDEIIEKNVKSICSNCISSFKNDQYLNHLHVFGRYDEIIDFKCIESKCPNFLSRLKYVGDPESLYTEFNNHRL